MGRRLLLRQHRTQPGTLDGDFGNIRVRCGLVGTETAGSRTPPETRVTSVGCQCDLFELASVLADYGQDLDR